MSNWHTILLIILYILFLDFLYLNSIIEGYSSLGFELTKSKPLVQFYFFQFLIFLYPFLLSFIKNKQVKFILVAFIVFDLVPAFIFYKYSSVSSTVFFFHLIFNLSLYFTLKYININIKQLKKIKLNYNSIFIITIILTIPFFYIYGLNVNLEALFFESIYESRADSVVKSNFYSSYTYTFIAKFLLPVLFLISLELGKYKKALFILFIFIYMFLIGAHKSFIFSIFFILIFYILKKYNPINTLLYIILTLLLILTINGYYENVFLTSFFLRRVLFFPILIESFYFDFFNDNYVYWSNSILSFINDYNFVDKPSKMIGFYYFNSWDMSANTGLISNGYMHFGYLGVLINIIIVNIYFLFIKTCKIKLTHIGVIIPLVFSFLSSGPLTVILTHGAGALVILYLIIKNNESITSDISSFSR
jgi:hypothetical protein